MADQPQGPGWGGDFSGQLNTMLAPYQQIAQRLQSPYATMGKTSWLAQNHPQLAGVLDNAFLTAAMTPGPQGPEGAGGGISRAFQGLVGGQQFRRQQAMQMAMLPYQMAMPGAQFADIASQISERQAMAPYYRSRADWYEARMGQMEQPRMVPGGYKTDASGATWQEIADPSNKNRPVRLYNPAIGRYADELPPEQAPDFSKPQPLSKSFMSGGGGFQGQLLVAANPKRPGETEEEYGQRLMPQYMQMIGQQAGVRTREEQAVTEPARDVASFLKEQRAGAERSLPQKMNMSDFVTSMAGDPDWSAKVLKDPLAAYAEYSNKYVPGQRQQFEIDYAKYEKSEAPKKGVSFPEYMKDRKSYDGGTRPAPPKVGDIVNGFKFKGGDPNVQASWERP